MTVRWNYRMSILILRYRAANLHFLEFRHSVIFDLTTVQKEVRSFKWKEGRKEVRSFKWLIPIEFFSTLTVFTVEFENIIPMNFPIDSGHESLWTQADFRDLCKNACKSLKLVNFQEGQWLELSFFVMNCNVTSARSNTTWISKLTELRNFWTNVIDL